MNCGECLMSDGLISPLRADGICPRCGADYRGQLVTIRSRHPVTVPIVGDGRHLMPRDTDHPTD
jgi:hypothetical protein